jgi:uncharacterized protein (TIGR00304 family)
MFEIGFGLTVIGLLVAFAGIILMIMSGKKSDSRVRGGGILLIGPIPIIFGTDRESVKVIILLAIAIIATIAILMILPYWLR